MTLPIPDPLPVNIDTSYGDSTGDATVKTHQQHHDTVHGAVNALGSAAEHDEADFDAAGAAAAAQAASQPVDADLSSIAALDSATAGALATDGSGWIRKTYAQLKTALGLGNVDNTSDAAKPISTATQTALDAKLSTATATGTYLSVAAGAGQTQGAAISGVRATCRKLLSQINPQGPDPFSGTLAADVPTLAFGTSQTLSASQRGPQTTNIRNVGSRGTWDTANNRLPASGASGLDFFHTGLACEISFFPAANASPLWIFIDGRPLTAAPDTTTLATTVASTRYFLKLTFGTVKKRRIEVFIPHQGSWYPVTGAVGDTFTQAPAKPVVAFVGDSFYGGSNGSSLLEVAPFWVARMLGVECVINGSSGTGWKATGSGTVFGSATRVTSITNAAPDLIVFQGSGNDGATLAQSDVDAALAAYAAALPNTPQIVLGPWPSNAVDTILAARATNNNLVRAGAIAGANVIGFHDLIGTAAAGTVPSAYNAGTTYNLGDLVTYKGSVWSWASALAGSGVTPGASSRWQLQTWGYVGTGQVGTTAGDGNRDTLLYSDGVHPTVIGQSSAFAGKTEAAIRADLSNYVANGTQIVA